MQLDFCFDLDRRDALFGEGVSLMHQNLHNHAIQCIHNRDPGSQGVLPAPAGPLPWLALCSGGGT